MFSRILQEIQVREIGLQFLDSSLFPFLLKRTPLYGIVPIEVHQSQNRGSLAVCTLAKHPDT